MSIENWLDSISGGATKGALAAAAGVDRGTFNRQYDGGRIPPHTVVAIARAYRADPLQGLVAMGLLTEDEISYLRPASAAAFLAELSDRELLRELLRRVDTDGELAHPELIEPLDENHPALRVIDEEPDFERMAAFKPPYDPDDELTERHDT